MNPADHDFPPPLIAWDPDWDAQVKETFKEERAQRQESYKRYTETLQGRLAVDRAMCTFNVMWKHILIVSLTEDTVRHLAVSGGGKEFRVLNRQADQSDGFKLKLVKGVDSDGKPVFTTDPGEALSVDGVFFFPEGYVVRIFKGFIPGKVLENGTNIAGRVAKQVTVELLNMVPPVELTQEWVNDNILGLGAYAFKVNDMCMYPAGTWEQHGVNRSKTTVSELNDLMERCHILIA